MSPIASVILSLIQALIGIANKLHDDPNVAALVPLAHDLIEAIRSNVATAAPTNPPS